MLGFRIKHFFVSGKPFSLVDRSKEKIMNRLPAIALIGILACNGSPKNPEFNSETSNYEGTKGTKNDEGFKKAKEEIQELFNDLLAFKNNSDFHTNGFRDGYKYNSWLKQVQKMKNQENDKLLIGLGFVPGDLEMLGFEYIKSKGEETDYSSWIKKTIEDGLKK